jgi:hypothetical protein
MILNRRRIMVDDAGRRDRSLERTNDPLDRSKGSGVVFALVALALILAIAFFYLTNERREDRRAQAVTEAAGRVDEAARRAGDAARNASDRLRDTR